jgi:hypothetical protein
MNVVEKVGYEIAEILKMVIGVLVLACRRAEPVFQQDYLKT